MFIGFFVYQVVNTAFINDNHFFPLRRKNICLEILLQLQGAKFRGCKGTKINETTKILDQINL
jgi:hypothetical protein